MAEKDESLKRETAGRYRSADGRFTVESQGANDWYLADEEQVDQLGQPVLRGPYASLAEARSAVAEARSEPVVGRALPKTRSEPATDAVATRGRPTERKAGRKSSDAERPSDAARPFRRDAKLPAWL